MDPQGSVGSSLRQRAADSAFVAGAVDAASRVLTVLLSIIAGRLLGPTEVGTLALAVTIVTILSMTGFFWETAAVLVNRGASDAACATAATVLRTLSASVLLGLGLWLRSPLSVHLTSTPAAAEKLSALLGILLWLLLIEALAGHPRVILQRRLELRALAWLQLLAALLFVGGALTLLQPGFGTVGMAWAQVVSAGVVALLTWRRPGKGRFGGWPGAEVWRGVTRGTWRLFTGGFLGFLSTRTDNMLVAGAIGETGMSIYSMAYNASRLPLNVLERVASSVFVPNLARIRDDAGRMQSAVDQALRHFYLAAVPVSTALLVSAPALVEVVLGARWLPLVPCLRVMCLGVIVAPTLYTAGAVIVALGRAQWIGMMSAALLLFQVLAIPPLTRRFGPLGAAFSDLASLTLLTAGVCRAATFASPTTRWRLGRCLGLPALAASCAGLLAWGGALVPVSRPLVLSIQLGIIALGYPLLLLAWGGGDRLQDFLSLLRGRAGRLSSP
jgi:PST family polysaccharide transporter